MAIGKMLSDEATGACSTQALNRLCFGTGPFPLLFPQARQNFDDRHKFSCFLIFLGLEALQATSHHLR